jgi:hypothetical protein
MKTWLLFLMAGTVTLAQPVANVSGKWLLEGAPGQGFRGGPQILTLNQVAGEVTGELGGRGGGGGSAAPVNNELWDGKVSGSSIAFYVWRGSDRPARMFYKGELNAAGDQITFTVTGGPGNPGAPAGGNPGANAQTSSQTRQVVAKRVR